jgi:hypothetical protein
VGAFKEFFLFQVSLLYVTRHVTCCCLATRKLATKFGLFLTTAADTAGDQVSAMNDFVVVEIPVLSLGRRFPSLFV